MTRDEHILNTVRGLQRTMDWEAFDNEYERYQEGGDMEVTAENLEDAIESYIQLYAVVDMFREETINKRICDAGNGCSDAQECYQ